VILPLKRVVLVAGAAGVAGAAVGYFSPAAVAATLSGIGGAVTAAAVQVGRWARRSRRWLATA
jgi:hypothetical protein